MKNTGHAACFQNSWGMETFRIPNSIPNAISIKAQVLVERIAAAFRALPDGRKPGNNRRHSRFDAACSTFSVFFTPCASFLAIQKNLTQSTASTTGDHVIAVMFARLRVDTS